MADLLDVVIVPRKVVTKQLGELDVTGLTLEGIAGLIKNHPEVVEMFVSRKDFNIQSVIDMGVEVLASFLAAGLGHPGDDKARKLCRGMNAEDAFTIGEAILEESFPGGVLNFIERVTKVAQGMGVSLQEVT